MLRESFSYATSQTPGFPLRKVNDSLLLQTRFHYDIEQLDVLRNRAQLPQERACCRNILRLDAEARLPLQTDARLLEPDRLAASRLRPAYVLSEARRVPVQARPCPATAHRPQTRRPIFPPPALRPSPR